MAKRISKETESKIAAAVERALDVVDRGGHPNDALTKAASEDDLGPGHVRLMVQAYNTGRTNYQRKTAGDLFEKSASFPLADAGVVIKNLYPDRVKTAAEAFKERVISGDYARPPARPRLTPATTGVEKAASARVPPYPRDRDGVVKRAFSLRRDLKTEVEEQRRKVAFSRDKVAHYFARLEDYFRSFPAVSYKLASDNARLLWGKPAEKLMARVGDRHADELLGTVPRSSTGREKQSSSPACGAGGRVDLTREPYSTIKDCLHWVAEHGRISREYETFRKEAAAADRALCLSFAPEPRYHEGSILRPVEKKAFLDEMSQGLLTGMGQGFGSEMVNRALPRPTEKLKSEALVDVMSPEHEARLRSVRAQAVLHNIMQDEYLSGVHPETLTNMYNEVARMSPRAVEQPMLMRALLRKYLASSSVDPHEVQMQADIEGKLKQTQEPSRQMLELGAVESTLPGSRSSKPRSE